MIKLRHFALLLALCAPSLGRAQAEPANNIRDLMTEAEFRQAGLEKLSPEELAALNVWLYGQIERERQEATEQAQAEVAAQVPAPGAAAPAPPSITPTEAFGREDLPEKAKPANEPKDLDEIVSTLVGEFRGWDGYTRFPLENGQVWMQSEPGRMKVRKMTNPKVSIKRGLFGAYFLSVEGYGKRVKVERIR